MRKYVALISVFLLIFVTTAGCIDIWLVKDTLVPREEKIVEYWDNQYNLVNKSFNSPLEPPFVETYNDDFKVTVKPGSKNMRFDIDVVMQSAEEYLEYLPIGGEIIENLSKVLSQRYVEVTIKMPDGTVWGETHRFNDTKDEEVLIFGPAEGDWAIEVEGDGIGFRATGVEFEYHDSISIDVIIKEPV